MPCH